MQLFFLNRKCKGTILLDSTLPNCLSISPFTFSAKLLNCSQFLNLKYLTHFCHPHHSTTAHLGKVMKDLHSEKFNDQFSALSFANLQETFIIVNHNFLFKLNIFSYLDSLYPISFVSLSLSFCLLFSIISWLNCPGSPSFAPISYLLHLTLLVFSSTSLFKCSL